MAVITKNATRSYIHYPSDREPLSPGIRVFVNEHGDRWYRSPAQRTGNQNMVVPYMPNTAHGRYNFDKFIADNYVSPRRAYRKLHDDYMLETKPNTYHDYDPVHRFPNTQEPKLNLRKQYRVALQKAMANHPAGKARN